MAGVKHTKSVNIADDASAVAASMVVPSDWNAEHTLSDVAAQTSLDALDSNVVSLRAVVSNQGSAIAANSAQMTSAGDAVSAAAAAASAAAAAVSAAHTSLVSDVGRISLAVSANSSQMTSADNAVSAAAAAASAAAAAASAAITSVNNRVSGISADLTSLRSDVGRISLAVSANSSQMTSADNAISAAAAAASAAAAAVSAAHTSLVSDVGRLSVAVSGLQDLTSNYASVASNAASMASHYASVASNAASVASAAAAAGGSPTKKVLAGDQIISATAPVSVSGMTFTCSAGTYAFEFGIFCSVPISLAGRKFVLSFPSSANVVAQYAVGGAVGGVSVLNVDRTNVTFAQVTVSAVGVPIAAYIRGTFRNSANGGTMALAMGNNVSGAGAGSAITVIAGSYGYVWKHG